MSRTYSSAFIIALLFAPAASEAAGIYLDPSRKLLGPGDVFIVDVRLDNEGECVNAIHSRIMYPTSALSAVDTSRGESLLSLWIEEPAIDRQRGTISFTGGIPAGYCGRIQGDPALSNNLLTIIFQVPLTATLGKESRQEVKVSVSPDSEVLLNDGNGTPAAVSVTDALFTIDKDKTDKLNEWQGVLSGDTTPPEPFRIRLSANPNALDGKYHIIFRAIDKQSGLDYFEVEENGRWRRAASPYVLRDQTPDGTIRVRAYDKAGNERMETYTIEGPLPRTTTQSPFLSFVVSLIVGILAAFGVYYLHLRLNNRKNTRPDDDHANTPSDAP